MTITDQELIAGCKDGKRDFQKALYKRFSGKMFGVCMRYTRNREEAEDLLQEGFIKVFRSIPQYQGTGSFEGWVRRIMVNTALESIRRAKIDLSPADIQDLEEEYKTDEDALSKMGVQDMLRMIRELAPGYQLVFNLFAIEGFSHKEIAEMLGISEGTSKSQLARARRMLQEKISNSLSARTAPNQ